MLLIGEPCCFPSTHKGLKQPFFLVYLNSHFVLHECLLNQIISLSYLCPEHIFLHTSFWSLDRFSMSSLLHVRYHFCITLIANILTNHLNCKKNSLPEKMQGSLNHLCWHVFHLPTRYSKSLMGSMNDALILLWRSTFLRMTFPCPLHL